MPASLAMLADAKFADMPMGGFAGEWGEQQPFEPPRPIPQPFRPPPPDWEADPFYSSTSG